MKRTIALLILLAASGLAFAQETPTLATMVPRDARTMAMGGAFVAMGEGYQSLYGNPAAFADKKAELTLLSVTPWAYLLPTTANIAAVQEVMNSEDASDEMASTLMGLIEENGLGAGLSAGMGWVGKGLGLGLLTTFDAYVDGKTLAGSTGTLDGEIAAVVGVGVPLELWGLRLSVGGDVRPFVRMTGDITAIELMRLMQGGDINDVSVDLGFGMAVDLGATLDLGNLLSVGLSIRDIAPPQTLKTTTVAGATEYASTGTLASDTEVTYALIPNITAGLRVTPIPMFLRPLVNVAVYAELGDPVGLIVDGDTVWNLLHLGAEADFLGGLVALRGGLNRGWISFGAGIDLLFLEVNAALFTEELGARPGDNPRTGLSIEAAVRF